MFEAYNVNMTTSKKTASQAGKDLRDPQRA
jgi:hypothetical protein